jgi:hypothetical protein
MDIVKDMTVRGIKPPAGKHWKRLQLDRMITNEKYAGDVVLQKTYIENHLDHRQIRNKGEIPMFHVENAHAAIVDRHISIRHRRSDRCVRYRTEQHLPLWRHAPLSALRKAPGAWEPEQFLL